MSSTNAGSIYYDVEMDIKGLLSAQQQVNARLDSMERGFNSTSKAVEGTERSFSSLTKISVALSAAMSVKQITEYATAWVDVNNKLANAVKTNESLAEVTSRVFDIAQSTKSDLQSTAALYGTLERSTRSLGLSSNDLSSVIKTVNEGLVLSGATTQEAAGATLQLSQALASGALRGDEFNSVSENGSRIAQALADSLGVNIGQLKVMAGQGKLTSDVVINGLLSQGATIAQEFNNHTTTLAQSLQIAGNNLTKFFGENTTVNTFLTATGSGIVTLSENISGLASVLSVAAVIMGGRYAASLTLSAAESLKNTLATIEQSKAAATAAQTATLRAQFEERAAIALRDSAFREVALAAAQVQSATSATEATAAQSRLSTARLAATDAAAAATLATNRLTAAQDASAVASASASGVIATLARGALGLVGGPVGVAMTAAAAIYYFKQQSDQAKKSANDLADSVGNLVSQFKNMSDVQLGSEIAKLSQNIPSLTSQVDDMQEAYNNATYRVQDLQKEISNFGTNTTRGRQAAEAMQGALDNQAIAAENLDKAQGRLSQTQSAVNIGHAQLNGTLLQGADLLSRESTQVGVADGLFRKFGQTLNIAAKAKQNFNSQSLTMQRPPDADDYLKQLKDENDLLGIQDLRQRAIAKGRLDFQNKMKGSKDQSYLDSTKYQADIELAGQLAASNYDEQQSNAARQKQQKAGITTSNQQAIAEESVAQKLDAMRQKADLSSIATEDLSLEQAKLQARLALGKSATTAQIAESDRYTTAIWQQAAAIKARNLVPETRENDDYQKKLQQLDILKGQTDSNGKLLITQEQYQEQSEQLAQQHQFNLAKIAANRQANVSPIGNARGEVDPVQRLTNQYNQQKALSQKYQSEELAILQAANAKKLINDQQYQSAKATTENQYRMLRTAADNQYDQQRTAAEWQLLSQQGLGYQTLTNAVDVFSQSAGSALTSVITGASSGKEAMEQLGQAILSSVVNTLVQAAVQALIVKPLLEAFGVSAESSIGASTAAAGESYAAWAPAAVAASIATLGSAAGIGLASYTGATLAGTAIGKGRKNGGPVSSGGVYPVGESNLPEFLQTSNGLFMIPGDNGRVFSNKDVTSGAPTIPRASTGSEHLKAANSQSGMASNSSNSAASSGKTIINISNYSSANVQAQSRQQSGDNVIDILIDDGERGGPYISYLQSTLGLSRKAQGDY